MTFTSPTPFLDAVNKLRGRNIVPSSATSAEWAQLSIALRERAFFSARVESARVLQGMRDYLEDFLTVTRLPNGSLKAQGRAEFVANMRELAIREGLGRIDPVTGRIDPEIRENDLTDIRSSRRLELVFDTITESSQEFGYWQQGQDPDILDVFPAQRFIRVRPVLSPRPYHQAALGEVRRKDDLQFWLSLNRDFNVPWGPWGYGSGCGVEDVDRDDAVAAGAMKPDDQVKSVAKDFNDGLSAGIRDFDQDIADALARVTGGTIAGGRLKPRRAPAKPQQKAAANGIETVLKKLGLSTDRDLTTADATRLLDALRKPSPAKAQSRITKIKGAQRKGSGVLTKQFIQDAMQDLVSLLDPDLVDSLPAITIDVRRGMSAAGSYGQTARILSLNARALQDPDMARKTIFHELIHWAHDHGPDSFRVAVRSFFQARTAGESVAMLGPWRSRTITGLRDKWADADGDEYAGRIYPWEANPSGLVVVTRHLEKLSDPAQLARHWNHRAANGSLAWREAFLTTSKILFSKP